MAVTITLNNVKGTKSVLFGIGDVAPAGGVAGSIANDSVTLRPCVEFLFWGVRSC